PLRGGVLRIVLALAVLVLLGVLRAAPANAESKAILSPASGFTGTSTNLRGSDFGRSQRVVIKFGRKRVAKTHSRRNGSFKVAFTVPADARGLVRVVSRSRSRRVINFFRVSTS